MSLSRSILNIVQHKNEQRSHRTVTEARRTDLATRLVDLAEAGISATGLRDLRARALAEAAGCSVGAIYGVFPDLDELVLAVNSRTLTAIDAAMTLAVRDCPTPMAQMERLASAYLDYAIDHRGCWNALFQHQMAAGRPAPDWYAARLGATFAHVEGPLAALRPDLGTADCARMARTVFAAVHGVVELGLGLGNKLAMTPPEMLHGQLLIIVEAMARGLSARGAP
jgi:AcrR family transcriptional regulator